MFITILIELDFVSKIKLGPSNAFPFQKFYER